jgi:DNA-binding NarL/FixJ family response regulator
MPIMVQLLAAVQFSNFDSTQWGVLVVGIMATLYLVMRGRAKRRKDPLERPAAMGVSQQRQIERDMGNLMVEMLATARQMAAQLDTRAARLEVLMKEADTKLAAMKAATTALPPVKAEPAVTAQLSTPSIEPNPEPSRPETPPDPRHAEVYSMADQGQSPNEIARHLNRPHGEVELILALRPH